VVRVRIDIGTRRVGEIDTEHAITLRFEGGATIRIESPVQISGPDRGTITVDPQDLRSDQDVQHAVLGRVVESAFADDVSGALRISFEGGVTLEVAPDPDFEPWAASWPDGTTVVALPGGGLSTWGVQS
jgi:hypothetical protein